MRKLLNIIALILLSGVTALGQGNRVWSEDSFLEKLQERDSVLIGDQLRYGFHLKGVPSGAGLMLPDFSKGFFRGDSVEIARSWETDTAAVWRTGLIQLLWSIPWAVPVYFPCKSIADRPLTLR